MKDSRAKIESPWSFAALAVAVVVMGLALWYAIVRAYPRLEDRASFGNLFGGINTLFAGLAFAALVYTLVLQQRALSLQRSELEAQRRELAEQNRRSEQQRFESMLVDLLGFHHDIARDVTVRIGQVTFSGSEAFRRLADELSGRVSTRLQAGERVSSITIAQEGYERFHEAYRGVLDHYFRNLYHIVKFIHESRMPEPRQYTSLVRAQLSPPELVLLFFNGLSHYGEKFKPLIEHYALLEQLPDRELQLPGHKALYGVGAYG